ncbi:hypothetical protein COX73_02305 [bacterium (Candidatus Gribaldobacteria) CG_4_10_14_0_2_um_filter_36_18]|uniref:UDP-N-acetylmuramoyl-L-alanyl-D-glutamate--2, 6-diaminopimelate ligase n=2 Tax=Candidatus Gribaldobacteria TaxID=2798536 RepID=A0A2M7VJY7_9BACT|nr:MAG: hypothetical protein COX73_02305 [bacterium (Candidatus Gribaldobacteria) CG_4_10_14_0_2_um_filter_36_18]
MIPSIQGKLRKIIPSFLLSWYHFGLAFLSALIYSFSSKKLKVIGVTGTKGKSTVVELAGVILENAGYKVASVSSIKFKIDKKEWPNKLKMTMPGRFKLQGFLRKAVKAGCQYAILEVTSEGILQHRQKFIDFDIALFTNLSPEHIERHGSFEKYRQAKGKLFQATKNIHVINIDDENAEYFLQFPAKKKYTYGLNKGDINNKDLQLNLQLIGNFNIYNALAAICAGMSQGVNLETSKKALEKVREIPGRMETVIEKPFKVIVDYAHTPDSLEKVYQTLKTNNYKLKTARMICVLGACGGGRDKWKRPKMGEIAAKYCDKIILTDEDPYDENPMEIIKQVAEGAENIGINQPHQHKSAVYKILDRREAIRKSLELARPGDAVIITGKGCEPWMCLANGKKIPWDDKKIVREAYNLKV